MVCITVVSRGEFSCTCSQGRFHFQCSKYQPEFKTQKRRAKGRTDDFLSIATRGVCAYTTNVWAMCKVF